MSGEYINFNQIRKDIYKGFKKQNVENIVEEMISMCCDQLCIDEDYELIPDYCVNSTFCTLINLAIRGKELYRKNTKEFKLEDFIL